MLCYELSPKTGLFLGYTECRVAAPGIDLRVKERAFFTEAAHAWLL